MSVKLEVTVETKADARIVFVNFKEVLLNSAGKGATSVELGEDNVLQWGIVGTPGTSYKITLKPASGTLKIAGQHPIELQIPKTVIRAAGNRRFRIL